MESEYVPLLSKHMSTALNQRLFLKVPITLTSLLATVLPLFSNYQVLGSIAKGPNLYKLYEEIMYFNFCTMKNNDLCTKANRQESTTIDKMTTTEIERE